MKGLRQIVRENLTKEEKASLYDIEDSIRFSRERVRLAQDMLKEQIQRKDDFFDYKEKQMGMA